MPGKKMNSIKNPKAYEAMRKKGMPKSMAAAMSNAQANKAKARKKKPTKKKKPRY